MYLVSTQGNSTTCEVSFAKGNAQVMELRVEDHIAYGNLRNMTFDLIISF